FLHGLMHIGKNQQSGGRSGESAALGLSGSLKELGLELGRLKTGTPPRLLRRSIDFSRMEVQPGDEPVPYFSYWKEDLYCVLPVNNVGIGMNRYESTGMFHVEQSGEKTRPAAIESHSSRGELFHVEHCEYPPGSILAQIGGQMPCYITYTT